MNKPCHRCGKTVYPVEKLNCLDKIWHKGCFNCETCHMTLSMKTYKGYLKLPYCNTHYPTTKFTSVADTPENLRLKKNTNNQSSVVYHKDFEEGKGKLKSVADDPETLRVKKTQAQASDIQYQNKGSRSESTSHEPPAVYQQAPPPASSSPPPAAAAPPPTQQEETPTCPQYVALYDYNAADEDEVSFAEGDIIINGEIIDDGWMTGMVQSTGATGMLPSNYVEEKQ